jgi:EAL domain-containing protein (putative c-di-GMP-specific phosphodiesterase class I)
MVHDLGIQPLAEGIEAESDHEICRQIGFACAQGFLYGHPALPKRLLPNETASADDTSCGGLTGKA